MDRDDFSEVCGFSIHFDGSGFMRRPYRVYLAGPLTNADPVEHTKMASVRCAIREPFRSTSLAHFEVYDPADYTRPGTPHSSEEVFKIDYLEVGSAHLNVFHACSPSHGVGIEAMLAANLCIPRVLVYPKGTNLSRMMLGLFNPTVAIIEYSDIEDIRSKLDRTMPKIVEAVTQSQKMREPAIEYLRNAMLGAFILSRRIRCKITLDKLAETTGISRAWLIAIERNDCLSRGVTIFQLTIIAQALDSEITINEGLCLKLKNNETLPRDEKQSIDYLVEFVRHQKDFISDDLLFEMWTEYEGMQKVALRGRDDVKAVWSVDRWAKLYSRLGEVNPRLFEDFT